MTSVLLANAPYTLKERYGKLASVGATLPCLGLLMLGAVLRKAGHRVRVVDAVAQGLNHEKMLKQIKAFQPDLVGLTAVTPSISKTARLASSIKQAFPSLPIVIGGPHFTAIPEKTLIDYPSFDYGIIGEGEHTVVDLIKSLTAGEIPSGVAGIAIRSNGSVFYGPARSPVKDLDSLPFPAWDLLEGFPDRYRPAIFKYKQLPSTHVISARGCPNKCIFCDTSVFGRRVRFHSPEYVLEMIDYLVKNFGIKEIIFEDDQFLLRKERVIRICEGLIESKLKISWCCSGRVNSVSNLSLLKLMKRSGCWQINYGIESGSQKILDFANKAITLEKIKNAVRLTHMAGILSKGYFIFGLPHETEETMEETIRLARSLPLNDISVFMLTPFPGSRMYKIAADYGTMNNHFDRMNILDVVYIPKGLSKEKLLHYQRRFMKEFYLRPEIVGNYLGRLVTNPLNVADMFKAACGFFRHILH